MRSLKWLSVAAALAILLTMMTVAQQKSPKGGEDESGPYEPVPNWPQPLNTDGWSWGSTPGVFAVSADEVFVFQRGELPVLTDPPGTGGIPKRAANDGQPRMKHVLMVFNRDGKLLTSWDNVDNMFVRPHSVTISPYDKDKSVWLIDDMGHQIVKFTHDGKKILMTLGIKGVPGADQTHFNRPTDIAFLPNGDFFVTDGYVNTRVVKFSSDGKYLFEWGKPGKGPGEFNLVHSIAIDAKGRIYIADRSNSRIQVFDPNGKYLDEWDDIRSPYHIYMSRDQYLWVSDGVSQKFLKYDLNGKLLYSWGTFGPFPGGLWGVHQFSVDNEGNLYTAEVFNGRVQKFKPRSGADPAKLITAPIAGR